MMLGDCNFHVQEVSFASQHLDEKWTTRGGFKFSLETLVGGENQKSINENTAKTQRNLSTMKWRLIEIYYRRLSFPQFLGVFGI
jgi:hypothetical protein